MYRTNSRRAAVVGSLLWCGLTMTAWSQETTPAKPPASAPAEKTPPAPATKPAEQTEAKPATKEDIYKVPDGTPQEIVNFLNKLQRLPMQFETEDAAIEHAIKVQRSIIAAGDKIMLVKGDIDTAYAGAEMKMEAISLLARAGIDGAMKEAMQAADSLAKDTREELAALGKEWKSALRIMSAPTLDEVARKALVDEYLAAIRASNFAPPTLRAALELGESLEDHENQAVPVDFYEQLAKLFKESGIKELSQYSEVLIANARRLNLPGNTIEITGEDLKGVKFDWAPYKGKVVLVDFWATWCGPCLAELPNLKENYEKYHAKGFEVVGVSLDDDKTKLANFLRDEHIPWVNLFAAPVDGEPQQPPAAQRYNVSKVPTCILVGRDGKVVSMEARGENLGELLKQLIDDAPSPK